ncbi:MAG: hypothetical protein IPM53_05195 [Anaerolineaceae bacterium]|nr:hypothetical protein [Anaerolineaceae bacterium]
MKSLKSQSGPAFLTPFLCLLFIFISFSGVKPVQPQSLNGARPAQPTAAYTVVPDQMSFTGDVVLCDAANIPNQTVASWCNNLPENSIMLGVDPNSPFPADWGGATATASVSIQSIAAPTIAVITIGWEIRDGKGIHSSQKGLISSIAWDGVTIWNKATRDFSSFGDYYAAQHYPLKATAVLTTSGSHSLSFHVPAKTAWDISTITIDLYPVPDRVAGIAYSPFRDCQNPHWGPFPTEAEIRADMDRMFHTGNSIRTYSTLDIVGEIPRIAKDYNNTPVFVGAWLGPEKDSQGNPVENKNQEGIDALIALANDPTLANIEGLIVGNEVLLRGDLTEAELINYINYVKARIPADIPVTTAEVTGILPHHPNVINAVDLLMIHIYPYWEQKPIEGAAQAVAEEYLHWQQTYGKRVIIGETGWPSAGPKNGTAVPSLENQRRFFYEFLIEAEEHDIEFFYFDTFDEAWKREGGVGSHWGYIDAARVGKHEIQSVMMPAPEIAYFHAPFLPPSQVYLPLVWQNQTNQATEFVVYDEYVSEQNHFAPSGWMGDLADISYYECDRSDPYSGDVAIRVSYQPAGPAGWAGIYWQEPAGNWGKTANEGFDLSGATGISFAAKGEHGGELISFGIGGIGCNDPNAPYPDSLCPALRLDPDPIALTTEWEVYTLPIPGNSDLSSMIGGFFWAASGVDNPNGITFYLDDIKYLFNVNIPLQPHSVYYGPKLASGYDMGVNTSGGQTNWVTDHAGHMCMSYPPNQSWGAVFVTFGTPKPPPRPGRDLSAYQTLSLDLKGSIGGESVRLALKDNTDPDNGSEAKVLISNLKTSWQTYNIPLAAFNTADLTRLYMVTGFVFESGTPAETVCFRNIRYLP